MCHLPTACPAGDPRQSCPPICNYNTLQTLISVSLPSCSCSGWLVRVSRRATPTRAAEGGVGQFLPTHYTSVVPQLYILQSRSRSQYLLWLLTCHALVGVDEIVLLGGVYGGNVTSYGLTVLTGLREGFVEVILIREPIAVEAEFVPALLAPDCVSCTQNTTK